MNNHEIKVRNSSRPLQTAFDNKYCIGWELQSKWWGFYPWFQEKHTWPISMPNSWSWPPTSTGAKSTIGSRESVCVRYSKTVLPHSPLGFWREGKEGELWVFRCLQFLYKRKHLKNANLDIVIVNTDSQWSHWVRWDEWFPATAMQQSLAKWWLYANEDVETTNGNILWSAMG